MKKKKVKNKKTKECPYCGYFNPCGNCAAKKRESEEYIQSLKLK